MDIRMAPLKAIGRLYLTPLTVCQRFRHNGPADHVVALRTAQPHFVVHTILTGNG